MFVNGPRNRGLIPGRIIPKTPDSPKLQDWSLSIRHSLVSYLRWAESGPALQKCSQHILQPQPTSRNGIYIFHIYCHPQTDCFVVSQLLGVARHWDWKPADSNANPWFYHSATRKPAQANIYHICFVYIYLLNSYRELNSFEEPCFTLVATITSLARELIYIHFSLSISCAIIVVFSIRIFQNLDLGIEWVLRC